MTSLAGMTQQQERNVETVRHFLALLHRKDIETWASLWHDDAEIIVFYPPEGFPDRIVGKAEIVTGFRTLFGNFETFDPDVTAIYPAADSEAVVVEYSPRATLVGGTVYTNRNIAVILFENGLIRKYHDYFDPRRFQTVVDALPKG